MAERRFPIASGTMLLLAIVSSVHAQPVPASSPQASAQPNVLLLGIDDFTRPYMRLLFEGFTEAMSSAPRQPAIYFETLDGLRFEEPAYLEEAREWLRDKYRGRHIDLVVTIGEDALGFLASAHGEPWPEAQVLFFESGSIDVDTRRLPLVGGMLFEDHFPAALRLATHLFPRTQRVALVFGAAAVEVNRWRGYIEQVRSANLELIQLVGVSLDDMRAEVARLPEHTVAIVLPPVVDAGGKVVTGGQVCEAVSSVGTVPTVMLEANQLGCGTIGGVMRDWSVIGRRLGREALTRLSQPSTATVTIPVAEFTTVAFDDRQLRRWAIPEQRLPAGASIRFREPDLWRDRRGLVLGTIGVTLLQSLLIAGLVFERRRRRHAEIESRRHLAAIAHLDRRAAMGELATSLAHEVNQPLNAILQNAGVAQILLTSNPPPPELGEMTEIISDIRKDDIRASEVIRRMRRLLQKHEPESRPVDINEVVQETVALVRSDARSRDIQLELELHDGITPILGDRVHLQQVLLNLLMNAMDAVVPMPAERRRVRVGTRQSDRDVRLTVADTGTGIPVERTAEIFEPFYTTKGDGRGMGMGLAIARGIVEAHGGRIAAENNAGGGATVWLSVPLPSGQKA